MRRGYAIETRRGFPHYGATVVDETPAEAEERRRNRERHAYDDAAMREAEERTGHWELAARYHPANDAA